MKNRALAAPLALAIALSCHAQAPATGVNYSNSTPAPPAGRINVNWQADTSRPTANLSANVALPVAVANCPADADLGTAIQNAIATFTAPFGGVVDARLCTNNNQVAETLTIAQPNLAILLPCATVADAHQVVIDPGMRNVAIIGCAYQGGSTTNGTEGGTVWDSTYNGCAFQVGDPADSTPTQGFLAENFNLNTASAGSSAAGLCFNLTQEIDLSNLYLIGSGSLLQTGLYLDGTGNYTGGRFDNLKIDNYGSGLVLTGHLSGSVQDDYANASTFTKLHIDCLTTSGYPDTGTIGINIVGGDGNTFVGGDVEGCDTMTQLGAAATSSTIR